MISLLEKSGAEFSPCKKYRYHLWRQWDESRRGITFVMLNPSTADELKNDPTVTRCQERAVSMGFGRVDVVNLFAYRATHPRDLKRAGEPIGPFNDVYISAWAIQAAMVVMAWGNHGGYLGRSKQVTEMLVKLGVPLYHLGITGKGEPFHPLMLSYDVKPVPFGGEMK